MIFFSWEYNLSSSSDASTIILLLLAPGYGSAFAKVPEARNPPPAPTPKAHTCPKPSFVRSASIRLRINVAIASLPYIRETKIRPWARSWLFWCRWKALGLNSSTTRKSVKNWPRSGIFFWLSWCRILRQSPLYKLDRPENEWSGEWVANISESK